LYPVKNKLAKRRRRYFNYLVIRKQKSIWLSERKGNDVWKGLHEFYMMETYRALRDVDAFVHLTSQLELNHSLPPKSVRMKQILSHQEIVGKFFELKVSDVDFPIKGGKFYSVRDIDRIAKPVLITKYLESIQ
jgi:A/G-specific adenine glycosylase